MQDMYCIVLYCIVLYCIVLYCIVLYCIVLYCIVLYCIVLYCIVLYCIAHRPTFFNEKVLIQALYFAGSKWPSFIRHSKYSSQFYGRQFFGRWREFYFYTACCHHKMAVSVAGSPAKRARQPG